MAPQFQPYPGAKTRKQEQDEQFSQISSGAQSLASLWRQHQLQKKQDQLKDLELDMKTKEFKSKYGTGVDESIQPGQVINAPPPTAGLEEQMFGAEISMPTLGQETPEQKLKRLGTEKVDALAKLNPTPDKDKIFGQTNQLRGQYISKVKDFSQVRDSYNRINEAAKVPSAAGDLALIFNYMKMLDPGSTVREGEFANAQNSAGVPERVKAAYNKAISGERLTDSIRSDFMKQAKGQYGAALSGYKKDVGEFRRIAESSGLDPDLVVLDMVTELPNSPKLGGGNSLPKPGVEEDGYRFKGGDPSDPSNWEKI